jgi:cyclopropane fatty-acyl-phospholipid synthase-like methyltransferase
MPSPSDSHQGANVQEYYNQTWLDYRVFWMNPDNRAIHFGYWDEQTRNHADSLINMNRQMARRLDLRAGQRVLDAGCGVGGSAMWLAQTYEAEVIGINIVADHVERAKRYTRERGLDNRIRFEQQDFHHTTFPDASFDVVWAQESVVHSPDKCAFLAEAFRLLKPGGRFVMLEYFRSGRPYNELDEKLLGSWVTGWAMPDLGTPDEYRQWAKARGFDDIRLDDIEDYVRPSHRHLFRVTMAVYWGESLLHLLRLRSEAQHANTRGARDQWRALQRGLWFEGILSARKPDVAAGTL